jgi:RNA polymerase sigma-70 factor (ECF subfamily)
MSTVTMPPKPNTVLSEEFERLYRENATYVYRAAYRITRNVEEAEDILQTIFLRLLRREFQPELLKRPRAYLYRAAVNAALDAIELRKNRPVITDIDQIESAPQQSDPSNDEKTYHHLHKAMAELSPTTAEIVILRYMHNYSDAQIAKMLGKSRGVVAVTLFRARAYLRKLIRPGDET